MAEKPGVSAQHLLCTRPAVQTLLCWHVRMPGTFEAQGFTQCVEKCVLCHALLCLLTCQLNTWCACWCGGGGGGGVFFGADEVLAFGSGAVTTRREQIVLWPGPKMNFWMNEGMNVCMSVRMCVYVSVQVSMHVCMHACICRPCLLGWLVGWSSSFLLCRYVCLSVCLFVCSVQPTDSH